MPLALRSARYLLGVAVSVWAAADTAGEADLPMHKVLYNDNVFPGTPAWVKETVPAWVVPHLNAYRFDEPIVTYNPGISCWQANHNIRFNPETAAYLYSDYTPLEVHYQAGSLPEFEAIVRDFQLELIAGDEAKALFILRSVIPRVIPHSSSPPLGWNDSGGFGLTDEELLIGGTAACHQQSRIFVRLCQVLGIPARIIFLAYREGHHTIAEFHAGGKWIMADVTQGLVFPGPDNRLMSAAECHRRDGAYRDCFARTYHARVREILAASDLELAGRRFLHLKDAGERNQKMAELAGSIRARFSQYTPDFLRNRLNAFGVINHPLPPEAVEP